MGQLKKMLRKHEKPLQQIVNRYEEKLKNEIVEKLNSNKNKQIILSVLHNDGPILMNIISPQYKKLHFGSIMLNISNEVDCYVMTKNREIIKVINIAHTVLNKTVILGYSFMDKQSFYLKPLNSSILDIYIVNQLQTTVNCWNVSDIYKKMIIFSFKNKHIAMPILHSNVI